MTAMLRRWRHADLEDVSPAFEAPDISRMLGISPGDESAIAAWLERRVAEHVGAAHSFAVDIDGRASGEVVVARIDRHGCGWLAYWIMPEHRGLGIVTRATASVVDWALGHLGLYRLELGHRLDNPASGAIARRIGFQQEGLQRQRLAYDGIRYDVATYGRLATDPTPDIELLEVRDV